MKLQLDQIPGTVTGAAEHCHQAGANPADVLDAIAWAASVVEGYDADRHEVHRVNVRDHAEREYYVLSVEHGRRNGTSPYDESDATFDKLTDEDRPVFYRRVAMWFEQDIEELAKRVADAVGEQFGAEPGYAPQVMDGDWDSGDGRVIVWTDCHVADWAYLAASGGISEYSSAIEYEPVPLPAGVWVEAVNPQALRVLPCR